VLLAGAQVAAEIVEPGGMDRRAGGYRRGGGLSLRTGRLSDGHRGPLCSMEFIALWTLCRRARGKSREGGDVRERHTTLGQVVLNAFLQPALNLLWPDQGVLADKDLGNAGLLHRILCLQIQQELKGGRVGHVALVYGHALAVGSQKGFQDLAVNLLACRAARIVEVEEVDRRIGVAAPGSHDR